MEKFITVEQLKIDNNLKLIAGKEGLNVKISSDEISRPGLEFAGFFDFFDSGRVILIGSKDFSFFETLDQDVQKKNVEKIFSLNPPCLVFSKTSLTVR